jgi:hypothetical protein
MRLVEVQPQLRLREELDALLFSKAHERWSAMVCINGPRAPETPRLRLVELVMHSLELLDQSLRNLRVPHIACLSLTVQDSESQFTDSQPDRGAHVLAKLAFLPQNSAMKSRVS